VRKILDTLGSKRHHVFWPDLLDCLLRHVFLSFSLAEFELVIPSFYDETAKRGSLHCFVADLRV
jgi:hypothetical protein